MTYRGVWVHTRGKDRGFTLIELLIVTAVITILAAIAIPNLLSGRMTANESAAIATLRTIASAQSQCQAAGAIDVNVNGAGEYGYFGELSAAVGLRDSSGTPGSVFISPPTLSGAFSQVNASRVIRSGYIFQVFLPDANALALPEAASGGVGAPAPDPTHAETLWCCYAWPNSRGTGKRCFFVSQTGDVVASSNRGINQNYNGHLNPPAPNAAFATGTAGTLASTVAVNISGLDGGFWVIIN